MDYLNILPKGSRFTYDQACIHLARALPDRWSAEYRSFTDGPANILQLNDCGFTYLFDFASANDALRLLKGAPRDDRVVSVFGRAGQNSGARDASRMKGFLGATEKVFGPGFDKGHFIAHSLGGGLDINLFPQRRALNRGWSIEGKLYVSMEALCRMQPGAFCFSRPVYRRGDGSWVPAKLEYGVLDTTLKLIVNVFDN